MFAEICIVTTVILGLELAILSLFFLLSYLLLYKFCFTIHRLTRQINYAENNKYRKFVEHQLKDLKIFKLIQFHSLQTPKSNVELVTSFP